MFHCQGSISDLPTAVIYGCEGLELTEAEEEFFRDVQPLGFILFARNVDNPGQVRDLTDQDA